ncbi:MAG: ATP-binding protein [Candidatus Zixiibacteriota bacterium]
MSRREKTAIAGIEQRYIAIILITLAVVVFVITWVSIKESREDSLQLLVAQGTAFVGALTEAADNAIESERFFDYLVHMRYAEIVVELAQMPLDAFTDRELLQVASAHNLYGIYIYGVDTNLIAGGVARGSVVKPPDFVVNEIGQLIANPENNYILLLDQGDSPDETVHYYIEMTNNLDRIVLIVADAHYYVNALSQTQIGFLVQKMGQEAGVEYIIYQSTDGIIFASRKTGSLLSIESDPFLSESLDSDSTRHRLYDFQGSEVLELVHPFATTTYPFGLLRIGLSLDAYAAISRGYDRQMITISAVLFVFVVVVVLYLNTRRKRKEIAREYRRMKSISDKIFDQMRIGVAAVDRRGHIILANEAFERTLGLKDSAGAVWDSAIKLEELAFKRIEDGAEMSFEKELSASVNNEQKQLLVAISKMKSDEGQFDGIVSVLYDVTGYRDLQRKSARKERLSEMGNLAAGVAHEIRNPLNTISIAAQRLAAEFTPSENQQEYLSFTKQIRAETKRLNEIITKFLALAHEANERRKIINLSQAAADFRKLVEAETDTLCIELSIDVDPALEIQADPDNLKQVLSNLFNNAKEALGGRPGEISISARKVESLVEIRFEDSGPGISPEIREKIFTPYYTTKEAGTGLGLPTVHRIISDAGGEVKVESSSLGGACFVITLPA